MSLYHESGVCQECGALLETEYEVDEGLCTDCYLKADDDEDDQEDCPVCGCSLNPRNPESCFCSYPED